MKTSTEINLEKGKVPCSITILTFNSGKTLRKCLESAKEFSEIIICDGGSTDSTLDIANEFGCKIIEQDAQFKYPNNKIANFSGVRNQTYEAATFDWFFYVDSDEYLSFEVVEEIRAIIEDDTEDSPKVYKTPRKFIIGDEIIDCAAVYPNYHIRFFHKNCVSGFRKEVHEKPVIKEGAKIGVLNSVTYVPTSVDYPAIKKKQDYYLRIEDERNESISTLVFLKKMIHTIRAIIVRIIKSVKVRLLCGGTKLPFKKDLMAIRYHLKLSFILIKNIF